MEAGTKDRSGHELGDPFSTHDFERLGAEVGEDHLYLTSIVAVDGTGRVEAGDAVLDRQARSRANLDLVALGDGDCEARSHGMPRARLKRQAFGSDDVESCRAVTCITGRRKAVAVRQALEA